MKLGDGGEAFFVFETREDVPESLQTSPLVSPASSPTLEGAAGQEPDFLDLEEKGKRKLERPGPSVLRAGTMPQDARQADSIGAHMSNLQISQYSANRKLCRPLNTIIQLPTITHPSPIRRLVRRRLQKKYPHRTKMPFRTRSYQKRAYEQRSSLNDNFRWRSRRTRLFTHRALFFATTFAYEGGHRKSHLLVETTRGVKYPEPCYRHRRPDVRHDGI